MTFPYSQCSLLQYYKVSFVHPILTLVTLAAYAVLLSDSMALSVDRKVAMDLLF
jgi:hypothetical protein